MWRYFLSRVQVKYPRVKNKELDFVKVLELDRVYIESTIRDYDSFFFFYYYLNRTILRNLLILIYQAKFCMISRWNPKN